MPVSILRPAEELRSRRQKTAKSPASEPARTRNLQRASAEELERVRRAVVAVGEAAYHWVIELDEIFWSANASEVLHCPADRLATGRAYADLLDTDNFTTRYDAVMRAVHKDEGEGIPYQIEYLFRPDGKNGKISYWLEDTGRWYADADGRPAEAFGIVRRIDDRHSRDQQLNFLGNCDPLTGMLNCGRMAEALEEAIIAADREGVARVFVIAGINNLAVVNDAYGFEVADDVIIAVGRRLKNVVRAGDPIARYSGSKFAVILNNCSEDDLRPRPSASSKWRAKASSRQSMARSGPCCRSAPSSCPATRPTPIRRWRVPRRR